ncbi:DegT/DnrJ/EryC1/StrS family aminotransferase [soil metagenome]
MIPVTKPFLPPLKEYHKYLEGIWKSVYLTNDGPLVQEFEKKIKEYLNVKHLLYLSNGTIALQIAIKALDLKGEIITTPFSYVATTSSIVWENCKPVFVDINPVTLNINAELIEAAITNKTTAILATHVFGNPCDIDAIQKVADKYNLKIIYDAAHCFGTTYKKRSVFEYGDASIVSFHATKLFHTVEGGAVFTQDETLLKRMSYMRNFGHAGPGKFNGVGINGKNSEFHAAMGLCNLNYIPQISASQKKKCELYSRHLNTSFIQNIAIQKQAEWNYSFYPVLFESERVTLQVIDALEKKEIYPRRYFYPSLDTLEYVDSDDLPVAESASKRVLCLPLYYDLTNREIEYISTIILKTCVNDTRNVKAI